MKLVTETMLAKALDEIRELVRAELVDSHERIRHLEGELESLRRFINSDSRNRVQTHYEGCDSKHILCAIQIRIAAALAPETP